MYILSLSSQLAIHFYHGNITYRHPHSSLWVSQNTVINGCISLVHLRQARLPGLCAWNIWEAVCILCHSVFVSLSWKIPFLKNYLFTCFDNFILKYNLVWSYSPVSITYPLSLLLAVASSQRVPLLVPHTYLFLFFWASEFNEVVRMSMCKAAI